MPTEISAPKPCLLAVDDDLGSAELVARLGIKCGYDARAMSDARALSKVLPQWKPSVLTLDLCMPEEDGIAVFETLRQCGFAGYLIIISGQAGWLRRAAGRLAEAHGLNFVGEMSKPLDVGAFRRALTRLAKMSAAPMAS